MPHKDGFKELVKEYLPYSTTKIVGIEIGCYKGEFLYEMLHEFSNLRMITIDPCLFWLEVLSNNVKYMDRLWILSYPSDIAVQFLDKDYDFVFIDGDHSYEQCKRDILNYMPLIRSGGFISGHNYHKAACVENGWTDGNTTAHPGVHQAVDEIFGDRVKLKKDFIWYVKI